MINFEIISVHADYPENNDLDIVDQEKAKKLFPKLAAVIDEMAEHKDGRLVYRQGLTEWTISFSFDDDDIEPPYEFQPDDLKYEDAQFNLEKFAAWYNQQ